MQRLVESKLLLLMKIYCDESGYTGGDLLEANQPYFVYSAVNFTDKELIEIEDFVRKNYQVQGNEIKGKQIINSVAGRKVIKYLFENYSKKVRVVYHNKKYALAAKIVEYGIEPFLKSNYQFYKTGLNTFIATGLYASFLIKGETAERLFKDFLLILRGKIKLSKSLLGSYRKEEPLFEWLLDIISSDPKIILDEIESEDSKIDKWILDLTMTSLLGLLSEWGKKGKELEVVCDNSKVFIDNPVFEGINNIGLNKKRKKILGASIGYELKDKITTDSSDNNFGVQVADIFASSVYYCLKNIHEDFSKDIMKIVWKDCVCKPATFCVVPDLNAKRKDFVKNKDFFYGFMQMIYFDVMASRK
jgi:hypothetical protein